MKGLKDVLLIHPDLHEDERGYFYEVFNENEFNEKTNNKYDFHVLQENESKSSMYVFRGLHFQKPPYEQAKLVRVLNGAVFDFAVDIRKDSPTFGKCVYAFLSDHNKVQFFVPRGFAHGFFVLSEKATFEYKCDNYYNKESESGIRWDDESIEIIQPEEHIYIKGENYKTIKEMVSKNLFKVFGTINLSEKDKNRTKTIKDL